MARTNGRIGRLEGVEDAVKAFRGLADHVQTIVAKEALRRGADRMVRTVQAKAPVSSDPNNPTPGSLRRSVRRTAVRSGKNGARTAVRADDVAAVPNEYGTSKMKAQPFFKPAVDSDRENIAREIIETIREEVETSPFAKG